MDKDDANEDKTSDGEPSTDRKPPAIIVQGSDEEQRRAQQQQQSQERDRKRKAEPSGAFKKSSKKPQDMPRRPLSSYNIFFQSERTKILQAYEQGEIQQDFHVIAGDDDTGDGGGEKKKKKRQGGIFQALARTIADRWKAMPADERAKYENLASIEMLKYRKRMEQYNQEMVAQALETRRVRKLHSSSDTTDTELPSSSEDGQQAAAVAAAPAVSTAGTTSNTGGARTDSASSTAGTDTSNSIQQRATQELLSNFLSQHHQATMHPNNSFSSNIATTPQTIPQFPFAMGGSTSHQPQFRAPNTTAASDLQGLINAYSQQQQQQQQQQQPPADLMSGIILQHLLGNSNNNGISNNNQFSLSGNHHHPSVSIGQPSSSNNSFLSPDIFASSSATTAAPLPPFDQNMINIQPQQQQQTPPNFPVSFLSGLVNPGSQLLPQQQSVTQSSPAPFTDTNLMTAILVQQLLQQQQQQSGGGNNQQP